MSSIRRKTILIVIGIVLLITVSTVGTGLIISQYRFTETVKSDLLAMAKIAAGMISAEISRMREEILNDAERLKDVKNIREALEVELKRSSCYLGLSLMDQNGMVLHAGDPDTRPANSTRNSEYGIRAFAGETVISTTAYTPAGNIIMRIWSPVDENHVIIAAYPGMYLSDLISRFRIWTTGNIFALDHEGVTIASIYDFTVKERHNYIERGKQDPQYRRMSEALQTIIKQEEGIGQYSWLGSERYCAYGPILGTDNWSAAVTAPLKESPLSKIWQLLFIIAAVFLGLGIVAALITAKSIAIPYEKMTELRRHAEAASESKTRFLANMSHEMRTPLNAIIGLSELELGSASIEGDAFINMEKIYSAGMTLLGIINDLLDISKIESGKFTLVPVLYDIPSMINDTINLNIVRIGSKPIRFRLHVDGSLLARLKGDELRVKQIFNNLLSNAFKYTDSGYVDWSLRHQQEGDNIKLISTIQDTGRGIRTEDQVKLFKDYYQANLKANYYVEGTGLGLSITNNLVKLMDGSIAVKSEYGKGSIFTVEIMQEMVDNTVIGDEAAANLSQFRYSVHRRTRNLKLVRADMSYAAVLVVDDVITNLDVTRGMLKPYGITVDCVTSGREAIQCIREEKVRYNAVFMDHMMPGMDGIETVRIIRNEIDSEYAKNIPIIALTANALLGNDSVFLENGFQAFLSKPIDILNLNNILNNWVRDKKQEKSGPAAPQHGQQQENSSVFGNITIPGLDIEQGLFRFDDDEESYLGVLRSFIAHTPAFIDVIRAAGPDTLAAVRVAAHNIKGSGRGIGAERLGGEAEQLETAAAQNDMAFIESHSGHFIATAEQLIADITAFLQNV